MWKKRDDIVKLDLIAVQKIMDYRRLTPYKLSRLIGKDKNEVKRWFTGELNPTWPNAHMIADALDCDMEHLMGKKPFVPDPEPETEIVPSADTASCAGATGTTLTDTGILGEIEVNENDLATWNAEQKDSFLSAIGVLLKLGCPVRLVGRPREGSVKLNLRLSREQWERLEQAFAADELAHLKITKVEPFYDLSEEQEGVADISQPKKARLIKPDGEKVCALCNLKGCGASELAQAAGIALATAKKIMSGEPCFRASLSQVAEALGVPLYVLRVREEASATPEERRYEFHIHLPIDRKDLDEEKITALFELLKALIGGTGEVDLSDFTDDTTIITVSLTMTDSFRLIVAMAENAKQLLEQLGATKIHIKLADAHYLGGAIFTIPYLLPPPSGQESIAPHKEVPIKQ